MKSKPMNLVIPQNKIAGLNASMISLPTLTHDQYRLLSDMMEMAVDHQGPFNRARQSAMSDLACMIHRFVNDENR